MPMIDVYATVGTFADKHQLAVDLATAVMVVEGVPDIPMFRQNTAAFVHELAADSLSNVDGDNTYVRVQVLTNAGALDRDKQLAVVERLTQIVAAAASDQTLAERTWVLLTEAIPGGWALRATPTPTTSWSTRPERRSPSCRREHYKEKNNEHQSAFSRRLRHPDPPLRRRPTPRAR